MSDGGLLGKIFTATSAAWTFVLMLGVALFKAWPAIMARVNERHRDLETAKAGDWSRLRDEIVRLSERCTKLEHRCDELQREVDECRDREAGWMARAIQAESIIQGLGETRQVEAIRTAAERLKK